MSRMVRLLVCFVSLSLVASAYGQDLQSERSRMIGILRTVSSDIEKNFYDPGLKGLDWKALTSATEDRIKKSNNPSEMVTAIFSFVEKLQDSHTKFLPPSRASHPLFGFNAKPFGDDVRIYQIKTNSAAAAAGLQPGDKIVGIDTFTAERNSFDLMMLYFHLLHPVPEMKITYQRGDAPPQTVLLQAKIKNEPRVVDFSTDENIWRAIYESETERVDYFNDFPDKVGYLGVSDFDTEEVLVVNKLDSPAAVVVDLRGNGGGLQSALLEFAGHFEPEATTMGDVVSRKKTEPLKIKPQKPTIAVPMVILVDSRTASAAEMFARHFQRQGRAIVVGDRSSGRVNSSRFFSEHIGAELIVPFGVQISVGKVVFPGGEELEHHGVVPDIPCVPSGDDLRQHLDPCLAKAIAAARAKAGLPPLSPAGIAQVNGFATLVEADRQQRLDKTRD
ncbi:MAG: S41 family peptidase [Terriglobales bacterium]